MATTEKVSTEEKMLHRIEDLLRLGESSNANEAALALAKAQELALKYNISLDRARKTKDRLAEAQYDSVRWTFTDSEYLRPAKIHLLHVIASHNFCKLLMHEAEPTEVTLFGEAYNIKLTQHFYTYIWRELWRLCGVEGERAKPEGTAWPTFTKAYYVGASGEIARRLKALRDGIGETSSMAIVLKQDERVDSAFNQAFPSTRKVGLNLSTMSRAGYAAGVASAHSLPLHTPLEETV